MTPLEWALLPASARAILRIFHGFRSRGQQIFPRQSWIAGQIGRTREHVNRMIGLLAKLGHIRKERRTSRFIHYVFLVVNVTSEVASKITSRRVSSLVNCKKGESLPHSVEKHHQNPLPYIPTEYDIRKYAKFHGISLEECRRAMTS